jgi:hypothetical protein
MAILIGFEAANSFVKATSTITAGEVDTYLNTLTRYPESAAIDDFTNAIKRGFYKIGDAFYKPGQDLKTKDTETSSSTKGNRYTSPDRKYYRECLVAIYKQLEKEKIRDVFNENIYVVTGIPVKDVKNYEKDIQELLLANDGKHTVNNKTFTIKGVKVISQGLSGFYDEAVGFDGEFLADFVNEAEEKEYLYTDIGFGSTDFQWISDLAPREARGMEGFGTVISEINNWAKKQDTGYADDNLEDFALIKPLIKGNVLNVTVNEVTVDKDEFFLSFATKVITRLEQDPFKITMYQKIKFCGGGAIALKSYLIKALNDKGYEKLVSRCEFNDELAQVKNARGYLKYGLRFFKKQGVEF